jgi:hypothetical protein
MHSTIKRNDIWVSASTGMAPGNMTLSETSQTQDKGYAIPLVWCSPNRQTPEAEVEWRFPEWGGEKGELALEILLGMAPGGWVQIAVAVPALMLSAVPLHIVKMVHGMWHKFCHNRKIRV